MAWDHVITTQLTCYQSDLTIVVRAKPASRLPISLILTNGDILVEIPKSTTIQHVPVVLVLVEGHFSFLWPISCLT